jgi:hypothetical protein
MYLYIESSNYFSLYELLTYVRSTTLPLRAVSRCTISVGYTSDKAKPYQIYVKHGSYADVN